MPLVLFMTCQSPPCPCVCAMLRPPCVHVGNLFMLVFFDGRYKAEFAKGEPRDSAVETAKKDYAAAWEEARKQLLHSHPLRLQLALNYILPHQRWIAGKVAYCPLKGRKGKRNRRRRRKLNKNNKKNTSRNSIV